MKALLCCALVLLPLTVACSPANQQNVDVPSFTTLDVSRGLSVTLVCGNGYRVEASARQDVLDKLVIRPQGQRLIIENHSSDDNILRDHDAAITVTINAPINTVKAQAGVRMTVPACAVSPDTFTVDGSMGTEITVAGNTRLLDLSLAMGSSFNTREPTFSAQEAVVNIALGVDARLCHVRQLSGTVTTGARVRVAPDTLVHTSNGIAGLIDNHGC
ncbi:DUF2807 domain-containing protein [Dickeya dianthicola]|uniref:GIN domain-containing protein n=1 Tax=Dickeya dianthicola TaxID=204039 RepID=UPI001866331E|nr:DUF2807 domain-containing protein [Dickeya dianthicola]MCI4184855.1 DUF2807 domain-containing protein [Dickeya dianthicola]QOL12832.1 hypothetical protein HGI48_00440 [Dickeya dianthicola]